MQCIQFFVFMYVHVYVSACLHVYSSKPHVKLFSHVKIIKNMLRITTHKSYKEIKIIRYYCPSKVF